MPNNLSGSDIGVSLVMCTLLKAERYSVTVDYFKTRYHIEQKDSVISTTQV